MLSEADPGDAHTGIPTTFRPHRGPSRADESKQAAPVQVVVEQYSKGDSSGIVLVCHALEQHQQILLQSYGKPLPERGR